MEAQEALPGPRLSQADGCGPVMGMVMGNMDVKCVRPARWFEAISKHVKLLRLVLAGISCAGLLVLNGQDRNPHGSASACGPQVKVDCACPGVVWQVQQAEIKKCKDQVLSPKEMHACLGRVPSHCEVMQRAHGVPEWDRYVRAKGILKMCGTQCHPNKCKCGDEPCKGH